MIGKAMIEIPPLFKDMKPIHPGGPEKMHYKNAEGLAEDVEYYGEWMRKKAFERIGHLYPRLTCQLNMVVARHSHRWLDAHGAKPDHCYRRSYRVQLFVVIKKGNEAFIEPVVDRQAKTITYQIKYGGTPDEHAAAKTGTKAQRGAHFTCLLSGSAIEPDYVKACGQKGEMRVHLMAIVADGHRGRIYVAGNEKHLKSAILAKPELKTDTPLPRHPQYIGDWDTDLIISLICLPAGSWWP